MTVLRDLRRQLATLQKPQTLHDLHNIAGRAAHDLVMQGFAQARDPYGKPWAPTKRSNPILVDSKALRDGITWKADSRGVVMRTTGAANKYAAFHQDGTRSFLLPVNRRGRFRSRRSTARLKRSVTVRRIPALPARKFLPDGPTIPPAWEPRLRHDFEAYLTAKFGRR